MKLFSYRAHFLELQFIKIEFRLELEFDTLKFQSVWVLYYMKLKFPYCLELEFVKFEFEALFRRKEWKGMKRIILEYSSIPLFGSFNGGNGKSIPLFGSLSGREWNG